VQWGIWVEKYIPCYLITCNLSGSEEKPAVLTA